MNREAGEGNRDGERPDMQDPERGGHLAWEGESGRASPSRGPLADF